MVGCAGSSALRAPAGPCLLGHSSPACRWRAPFDHVSSRYCDARRLLVRAADDMNRTIHLCGTATRQAGQAVLDRLVYASDAADESALASVEQAGSGTRSSSGAGAAYRRRQVLKCAPGGSAARRGASMRRLRAAMLGALAAAAVGVTPPSWPPPAPRTPRRPGSSASGTRRSSGGPAGSGQRRCTRSCG